MRKVSVIVINYNTPELTERALLRLFERANNEVGEVVVIDNGSVKKIKSERITDSRVKFIFNNENIGFAKAVNQGLKVVSSEYVLLLNSDVILKEGAVATMLGYLELNAQAGIVGPRMVYPDNRFQVSCGYSFSLWSELIRLSTLYKYLPGSSLVQPNRFNHALFTHGGPVGWVSGGCMLVRRAVIERIGELDEHFFFGVEDIDFCHRAAEAGWQTVYLPSAEVVHYHGYSSGGRRTIEKMRWEKNNLTYFLNKHWPEKKIENYLVNLVHCFKICLIKLIQK
jgi:GT2 family glycosyltransferase